MSWYGGPAISIAIRKRPRDIGNHVYTVSLEVSSESTIDICTEISVFCRHICILRQICTNHRMALLKEVQILLRIAKNPDEEEIIYEEMYRAVIVLVGIGFIERN
jgi:hypothetical protein